MILFLWITMAFVTAMYASTYGEYGVPYFLISFALSPIAGWIILQMRMEIVRAKNIRRIQIQMEMKARRNGQIGPRYVFT